MYSLVNNLSKFLILDFIIKSSVPVLFIYYNSTFHVIYLSPYKHKRINSISSKRILKSLSIYISMDELTKR